MDSGKGRNGIYSGQDHGFGCHTDFGNGKGNLICRYTCDKWTGIYIQRVCVNIKDGVQQWMECRVLDIFPQTLNASDQSGHKPCKGNRVSKMGKDC